MNGMGVVRVRWIERKSACRIAALTLSVLAVATTPADADAAAARKPAAAKPAVRKPVAKPATTPKPSATPNAAAEAPAAPAARPIGNPGDWFPPDSYPPEARVANQEGRTVFALDIDARGRIMACHIVKTSGSDLLDSTTCSQLIANGRFEPAKDTNGRPVAGQWRSAMRWQLQAGGVEE